MPVKSKLTEEQVEEIRARWAKGEKAKTLAEAYGVSRAAIYGRVGTVATKPKKKRDVYTTIPLEGIGVGEMRYGSGNATRIAMFVGESSAIAETLGALWK